jgi:hypothetical protein
MLDLAAMTMPVLLLADLRTNFVLSSFFLSSAKALLNHEFI